MRGVATWLKSGSNIASISEKGNDEEKGSPQPKPTDEEAENEGAGEEEEGISRATFLLAAKRGPERRKYRIPVSKVRARRAGRYTRRVVRANAEEDEDREGEADEDEGGGEGKEAIISAVRRRRTESP